jgi:hypothetical protein
MGGTTIQQPTAPTTTSSISDWVANYPQVFALQQKYAPQEAQQQVDLANQYAGQLGTAYKSAQEAMYPDETAFIKDSLNLAKQGQASGLPNWAKQSYMDTMRAQLGENALAGSGADYMSQGLIEQQKNWQDYYTNLGLSIAGKQPVYNATQPATSNYTSTFTPSAVMGSNNQNYGTAANIYGTQAQMSTQSSPWMSAMGSIGGSVLGGAFGLGGMFGQTLQKR